MGWTKFYKDRQPLREPDSWSRTPLINMSGVELVCNDRLLAIHGFGEYWQSDSFESRIVLAGSPPSKLTHRRIEKYIDKQEFGIITQDNIGLIFDFRQEELLKIGTKLDSSTPIYVPIKDDLPYWLILELDVINNRIGYYHSKERI